MGLWAHEGLSSCRRVFLTLPLENDMRKGLLFLLLACALGIPRSGYAQNCYNSNTDENIIEYFNLINYMGDFMLKVVSKAADSYDVSIICPQKQSSDMPPHEFSLSVTSITTNLKTECYSDTPLTISKTNRDCDNNGECNFIIVASNSSTSKIYSQTKIKLVLKNDELTNPELNPASLPICLGSVTPCLKDGECSLVESSSSLSLQDNKKHPYGDEVNFKINPASSGA
ncbi:MAG: hypothetical protein KDD44_09970, partial [Bdellovibrionales bacterium]|nr:hypothetical protein [Bdellovibrionales bacterium]